jgi:GDP-6-deoxy-D-talose 4-dehydrogenase
MAVTLITGGTGFTGRHLAAALAVSGDEVHSLDHHRPTENIPGISHSHVATLQDPAQLKKVIADVKPEKVVHLAAIAFVAHGDIDEMYRTNIIGTRNLLDALAGCHAPPQSVLLASSANIYGNTGGVISEDKPPAPVAKIYAPRLPIIVARPFNYTGLGQSKNFIIPKIIDYVRRKATQIELGNINVARDFSDVRCVIEAYVRLLSAPEAAGKTVNICSGTATSLREILSVAQDLSGHEMAVVVNPDFVRANDVNTLCGDRSYLESIIGPLDVPALSATLGWMLKG